MKYSWVRGEDGEMELLCTYDPDDDSPPSSPLAAEPSQPPDAPHVPEPPETVQTVGGNPIMPQKPLNKVEPLGALGSDHETMGKQHPGGPHIPQPPETAQTPGGDLARPRKPEPSQPPGGAHIPKPPNKVEPPDPLGGDHETTGTLNRQQKDVESQDRREEKPQQINYLTPASQPQVTSWVCNSKKVILHLES